MSDDPRVTVPAELVEDVRKWRRAAYFNSDHESRLWLAVDNLLAAVDAAERPDKDVRPCKGQNTNICVAEGCYAEACLTPPPPAPVSEPLCRCGHVEGEHNFQYITKGVCHVAPCTCAGYDTAREERDRAEAMIDRFRLAAIQASDNRDSVAAELDALRTKGHSLADYWEGHSRQYPTIGRQAAALELRDVLATPAPPPVPVSDEAAEDEPISAEHLRKAVLQWASRFIPGDRWDPEDVRDLETALGGTVENRCHHRSFDAAVSDEAEAAEAVRNGWIYGREGACRFIARTAWPWEAESNRDSWASRIGNEPEFGRKELALAHRRLDQAAETLGLRAARQEDA